LSLGGSSESGGRAIVLPEKAIKQRDTLEICE
jgi:hypothetical protein